MITEDYVSFETAKLLKERGFDEECSCFYDNIVDYGTPGLEVNGQLYYKNSFLDDEQYAAPTLQMAMKWLRKVHRLEIYPFHDMLQGNAWWYRIERNTVLSLIVEKEEDPIYGTYEQACEEAIKYCLEHLI